MSTGEEDGERLRITHALENILLLEAILLFSEWLVRLLAVSRRYITEVVGLEVTLSGHFSENTG